MPFFSVAENVVAKLKQESRISRIAAVMFLLIFILGELPAGLNVFEQSNKARLPREQHLCGNSFAVSRLKFCVVVLDRAGFLAVRRAADSAASVGHSHLISPLRKPIPIA